MASYCVHRFGGTSVLVVMVVVAIPYWRIVKKAGYSGGLSLLMFIPLVNIAMLYWFAFTQWPIEKRVVHTQIEAD